MKNNINKKSTHHPQMVEIGTTITSMLDDAPNHGILTVAIHVRDGFAYRLEATRQESILLEKRSEK